MTREEIIKRGKKAYGCAWELQDQEKYISDMMKIHEEAEKRHQETMALIDAISEQIKDMPNEEAFKYTQKAAREAQEAGDSQKRYAYHKAYTIVFEPFRLRRTFGVYDMVGQNYSISRI